MLCLVFIGWKWLWIPLLVIFGMVFFIFMMSILYFLYAKFIRASDAPLTENLDKEEAMPRIP